MGDTTRTSTDTSTTRLARATNCCGGSHQTIAGAILRSPQWQLWKEEVARRMEEQADRTIGAPLEGVWDVDECEMCDAMSSEHFQDFLMFIERC